ncbi:MAG: tRNA uridine-5-carboxymethylaminomethyl(34) synthesis GTPase MnmE [Acidobacteria bacterium]|nr:MAG: tRNA uridine-5-carboxymethylaminomethyl(34) synthesis GTPase MnmE [Acidobacteriota bacterium]REJ98368.1 MAG: tRNA uridine-5-carboxymethylaminomethyl(34) synthesis GTPase MnmE [Acidobacteriota bacterium]REK17112.1 MAG: tRNA uridine-5-carboxymethylaminomethyl(34) synthesis GTPase MnmE [Acidobacteriota bacterium]REK43022.1 MAG: tRNA uridine-5-carboxymethylaminomethyl(34) synthesis GTPase MnmE [Acidobacteriota bacterium]
MDTIVALSTPLGRSGIGVVRLSGDSALEIAGKLTVGEEEFEPRHATLSSILDSTSGEIIDEAIVTYFKSPNTYTGEDVVEISCHGSPVLLRRIIDLCLGLDARLAEPGEFTLRALSNGRLDLSQAEAIRDLIDSNSIAMTRQAVRQLRGEFSHTLQPLKDKLLDVIVVLESALEFVEDDLPEAQTAKIAGDLRSVAGELGKLASTYSAGRLLREGLKVALVGRPNVGKSSLFNALLGQDRAIVTEIPGTTRDQIHESFTIRDIPVSLIDTAGMRETVDTVETIGVERARRAMADADVVVVVLDGNEELTLEDREVLDDTEDLSRLIVVNKTDIADSGSLVESLRENDWRVIGISAKTSNGLDELQEAIVGPFSPEDIESSGFLVSDARHHDLLKRAKDEIESSIPLLEGGTSEEIVLVGLHNAIRYLGEITGETTTEDMLTRIFQTFCIGK